MDMSLVHPVTLLPLFSHQQKFAKIPVTIFQFQ